MDGQDVRARLTLARPKGFYRDAVRRYEVYVDGTLVARLRAGEVWEGDVEPGEHHVTARIDWTGSATYRIELEPGGEGELTVEHASLGSSMSATFGGRGEYLTLTDVSGEDLPVVAADPEHRRPPPRWLGFVAVPGVLGSCVVFGLAVGDVWAGVAGGLVGAVVAALVGLILVRVRRARGRVTGAGRQARGRPSDR